MVSEALDQLGEPCKSILRLQMKDFSFKEIAEKLNYDNPDTPKNQAARCRKKLRSIITDNEELRDLLNDIK